MTAAKPFKAESFSSIGEQEAKTNQQLDENVALLQQIKTNMMTGNIKENINLMARFRSNVLTIMQWMTLMPGTNQLPPLPVQPLPLPNLPSARGMSSNSAANLQLSNHASSPVIANSNSPQLSLHQSY
mmetsp:Transcript_35251/g.56994  ORF Transcript_35251/g.56994 Transcript_35251/m.56994 type:complete len:128 (-) Transcript_35251:17-400(-)